jgi:hypothetical protein
VATRAKFKFGTCTVPDGKSGPWKISTFRVTKKDAAYFNFCNRRNPSQWIEPGTYRRLSCEGRGVIMSNTPMEIRTNYDPFVYATGRVLINGLGLGMLLEAILSKPDVTYVRVIEIDEHVIRLVAPHFARDKRVEIVHANALTYRPARGEKFDYVWHDIWDVIDSINLPEMATLGRRYNRRIAVRQGWWARDIIRQECA